MRPGRTFPAALLALVLASCQGGTATEKLPPAKSLDAVRAEDLRKLLGARVFFGHQSIGFNIVDGIGNLPEARGLAIVQTRTPASSAGPGFFHAGIGRNGDPLGKMRDFEAVIRGMGAEGLDIAFMKLCFVDIMSNADVPAVFGAYRDMMAALKAEFPGTVFVHCTVAITQRQTGIKPFLRKLMGRQVAGFEDADNAAREELNALLRNEYGGREPLFDIALLESMRPDGARTAYESNGRKFYAMAGEYTDDGGHLNKAGRAYIAEQLIVFLTGVFR